MDAWTDGKTISPTFSESGEIIKYARKLEFEIACKNYEMVQGPCAHLQQHDRPGL
jgi:hypothetical protein